MLVWIHDDTLPPVRLGDELKLRLARVSKHVDTVGLNIVGIVRLELLDTHQLIEAVRRRIDSRIGYTD